MTNSIIRKIRCRIALLNIGQGELAGEARVSPATVRTLMESDAPNLTAKSIDAIDAATLRIAKRRWQDARVYAPQLKKLEL